MNKYLKIILGYLNKNNSYRNSSEVVSSRHLRALPVVVDLLVDLPSSPDEFVVHTYGNLLVYTPEENDSIIIGHSHSL